MVADQQTTLSEATHVQTDRMTIYAGISTSSYELEYVDSSKFENNYISSATLIASIPHNFLQGELYKYGVQGKELSFYINDILNGLARSKIYISKAVEFLFYI